MGQMASANVVSPGDHADPHDRPGASQVLAWVEDVSTLLREVGTQRTGGQGSGSCPESVKEALFQEVCVMSCHVPFCVA